MKAAVRTFFAGVLLVFGPLALIAQTESVAAQIIVVSDPASPAIWKDTVESQLSALPEVRRVHRVDSLTAARELAEADRIPLIVTISNDIPAATLGHTESNWAVIDAASGNEIASGKIEGVKPRNRDLTDYWWLPLVAAVKQQAPAFVVATGTSSSFFKLAGSPGTVVTIAGYEPIEIPESGVAEVTVVPVPGTYSWVSRAPENYPERGVFTVTENGETLAIPSEPIKRFGVEIGLLMGQFPDLALSILLDDGSLFIKLLVQQYLAGLYLGSLEGDAYVQPGEPILISLPLLMPGAQFGFYLNHPDDFIRAYFGAGAFLRILPGEVWFLDPIAPLGLTLTAGAEMTLSRSSAFFGEVGASMYLTEHVALLEASHGHSTGGGSNDGIVGEGFLVEFPSIRFGFRLRF